MSSRKAAVAKARRPTGSARAPAKPKVFAATELNGEGPSADAKRLAAELERALADGRLDALSPEALQALMAALCNTYAAQIEAGAKLTPIAEGQVVSPTGVMLTASGLLRAANLAVFELGMWQSWTGR
jgi:hypothetical protein